MNVPNGWSILLVSNQIKLVKQGRFFIFMAGTTLEYSQAEALGLMGFERPERYAAIAHELLEITNDPYLGSFTVGEGDDQKLVHAFRAHSGPEQDEDGQPLVAKGGLRSLFDENPDLKKYLEEVCGLSQIMLLKLAALGLHRKYRGGKGLMVAESDVPLNAAEMEEAMRKYYRLMEEREYNRHDVDVPAGDLNIFTNHLDFYADEHQIRHPEDPFGLGIITGTSPKYGGSDEKVVMTGFGCAASHVAINQVFNGEFGTTAVRGFGDVGAWYAHYATLNGIRVMAISDKDGMVYTDDPAGLPVDRHVIEAASEHPDHKTGFMAGMFRGMKMKVEHEPSGLAVYDRPVDTYLPAVCGGEIDSLVAERLFNSGVKLVLEAANAPTTYDGHMYLMAAGVKVGPDMVINGAGVHSSTLQHQAAEARARGKEVTLTDQQMKDHVWAANQEATLRMLEAADELGTPDWRVSAIGLSTGRLFVANSVPVPDDVRRLVSV